MRIMAIGIHPDDVEIGCGGTVALCAAAGDDVTIVDLTRGESATNGTPEERAREAAEAARILGAARRENARIPDTGVQSEHPDQTRAMVTIIRAHRPAVVLFPNPDDPHPDHASGGVLIHERRHQQQADKAKNGPDPWDALTEDLEGNGKRYQALIGPKATGHETHAFLVRCYQHVWHNPTLLDAKRDSLLLAFAEAAVTGLELNPTARECYIEVRGGFASFKTQYQGLVKLMHRGNDIDFIFANVVRPGDIFEQIGGSTPMLRHVAVELGQELDNYDSDDAILASYAVVRLKGATLSSYEVARRRDINKAMAQRKGKNGAPSPAWTNWFDRMARKLPVRRLANLLPGADARVMVSVEDAREEGKVSMLPRVAEVWGNTGPRGAMPSSGADKLEQLMATNEGHP